MLTDALVFQGIDGLTLRNVEVTWDREAPEPKRGSALVLRNISDLRLEGFRGEAALEIPAVSARLLPVATPFAGQSPARCTRSVQA